MRVAFQRTSVIHQMRRFVRRPGLSVIAYLVAFFAAYPSSGGSSITKNIDKPHPHSVHVGLTESETGRSLSITHSSSAYGRTMSIQFSDPATGSLSLSIDRNGHIDSDFGFSLHSNVMTAAWTGRHISRQGEVHGEYRFGGSVIPFATLYDLDQPMPQLPPGLAPSLASVNPTVASFVNFMSRVGGIQQAKGTQALPASGFLIDVADSLHLQVPSQQGKHTLVDEFPSWYQCAGCLIGVVGAIGGGIGITGAFTFVGACTLVTDGWCLLFIGLWVAGSAWAAGTCASCAGDPDAPTPPPIY